MMLAVTRRLPAVRGSGRLANMLRRVRPSLIWSLWRQPVNAHRGAVKSFVDWFREYYRG